MVTGSKELIRDMNSHLVLESIVNSVPVSRAELSKRLGLTKATISAIVADLVEADLVVELGSADTMKGRKPILFSFNQNGGYVLSIDLSVDTVTVLVSDLKGEHCCLKQYPYDAKIRNIIDILKDIIQTTIDTRIETVYGFVGISIGIHGVVQNNIIEFSPYYNLEGINLAKELQQIFDIPVYIENEANLSVQGERSFYYNYPNIVSISVHSGIGLGLIINDTLFTGSNGHAGEFGHTIIEPNGRECPCGNHGCIEQYASERALLTEYALLKGKKKVPIEELVQAYQKNDKDAMYIMDNFVTYISMGINNILNTFNPNIIIINSSFTIQAPGLTKVIHSSLKNRMAKYCKIVPSQLQDTSILLGGVCVCIKQFLGIDYLKLNHENTDLT